MLALDPNSSVFEIVAHAWAGFGAAFGPVILCSLFWGTRTLLQMLRQTPGSVPCGTAVDFPRYQLRGKTLPPVAEPLPDFSGYDLVIVGAPVWMYTGKLRNAMRITHHLSSNTK